MKGNDLCPDIPQTRQDVTPESFKTHFENLFSRTSQGATLGLTTERIGPKSALNMELSGPPSLYEVKYTIGRLRDGTAPGANGLRPEVFKGGRDILAHHLQQDFGIIWPSPGPNGDPHPTQITDDGSVTTLRITSVGPVVLLTVSRYSKPGRIRQSSHCSKGKVLGAIQATTEAFFSWMSQDRFLLP